MNPSEDAKPTPAPQDASKELGVKSVGRFIAVGGGRGGVGKSLVAANLAVYFAQLGKGVVLVDADAAGANLHSHFGLKAASAEPDVEDGGLDAMRKVLVGTSVPGLWLLPGAHDAVAPGITRRAGRTMRWLAGLRALPAEYLVVDVGPGHGDFALDLMLASDIALAVTVPEPPAVEATYRFLRAAFRRRLKRVLVRDRLRSALLERALLEMGTLPAPIELVHKLARMDKQLADLAWNEAQALRVQLVVNQTRVRTDMELGAWMSGLASRHYGIALDELGHVEHDDTVWVTVRRNKPLLVDSPTSKAARNVERIARRVLALAQSKLHDRPAPPPPVPTEEPTMYAVLGVTRSASDEEVRRAYKRQREIYASGGLATVSLLDPEQLAATQRKLEEAYDTLLDPVRRRAYDLSTFPEPEPIVLSARATRPALAAEQLMLREELQREIGPDTEFTGALLRKVRESLGLELVDISAKTKIARSHLQAIEEERFEDLPAIVYTRGFLVELAKQLRLEAAQVQKTYLRRYREEMTARGKELT